MALEFDKEDLKYIKRTIEWMLVNMELKDTVKGAESLHNLSMNSINALERGLAVGFNEESATLPVNIVSGSAFIAKADRENILVLVDDKYKVFNKLREIGKTWKSITIEQIDKVV